MNRNGQTICLSMIVKDESPVIARCLESVKPFIDRWAILDTGSSDDTPEKVSGLLASKVGELRRGKAHHRSWWDKFRNRNHFDFAARRNEALEMARAQGCDYILIIDADEEFCVTHGCDAVFPPLTSDRYVTNFRLMTDGRLWHRTILLRSAYPWRYRWPIHETLDSDDENATATIINGLEVKSWHDSARNQDRTAKFASDAEACKAAIRDEPDEPRHKFYLGQSLAGCGRYMEALIAYERRAADARGWDEERWYALYQQGPLRELLGYPWQAVREKYLEAFAMRPWRAEPLWAAGVLSVDNGEPAVGELYLREAARLPRPPDSFLIDETIYSWRAADDWAGALAQVGDAKSCIAILDGLKENPALPEGHRQRIEENLQAARDHAQAA